MKTTIHLTATLLLVLTVSTAGLAQSEIKRTVPAQMGQRITIRFDYPELIRVSTWDRNEVSIQGNASINHGENDDAFQIDISTTSHAVDINGYIRDIRDLPERVSIEENGKTIVFRSNEEWRQYQQEHGKTATRVSIGPDIEIQLDIKVPANTETIIESVYGMVEVANFTGPLSVRATYGGVDAALAERDTGEITAETNFGEIFTNLDTKFGSPSDSRDFHTVVSARPGNGPRYNFESKYGNVYLRKAPR